MIGFHTHLSPPSLDSSGRASPVLQKTVFVPGCPSHPATTPSQLVTVFVPGCPLHPAATQSQLTRRGSSGTVA